MVIYSYSIFSYMPYKQNVNTEVCQYGKFNCTDSYNVFISNKSLYSAILNSSVLLVVHYIEIWHVLYIAIFKNNLKIYEFKKGSRDQSML